MKYMNLLAITSLTAICLSIHPAYAEMDFTSHHSVYPQPYSKMAESLDAEAKLRLRTYLDYEEREPCQNYRPVPEGFIKNGCYLGVQPEPVITQNTTIRTEEKTTVTELRPVIRDYKIHFDFDKSNIRASEYPTLSTVADEIKTYEPHEVTIEGHADRSGSADYNLALSKRRAQAVSQSLTERGILNRILDQEAYGESQPEIPTEDGVKLEANRRVVIQFRK